MLETAIMEENQSLDQKTDNIVKKKGNDIKKYFSVVWEFLKVFIIAAIIVLPIRYFIFQPFIVKGESMLPNFQSGDYLIVDEVSYRIGNPRRGDVVVLKYPLDTNQRFIKRIIGLPGETIRIKNGEIIVSKDSANLVLKEEKYLSNLEITEGNLQLTLSDDEYFVLGDNRDFSYDSRRWGVLPGKDIIGRVILRVFPIANMSYISEPAY